LAHKMGRIGLVRLRIEVQCPVGVNITSKSSRTEIARTDLGHAN
jgi:hypothetical protein